MTAPTTTPEILTDHEIARVARRFGLSVDDPIIRENAAGARQYHGTPCPEFNGDTVRYWHINPYTKAVDAGLLFQGWVKDELRERDAECASTADFHERAYGEAA